MEQSETVAVRLRTESAGATQPIPAAALWFRWIIGLGGLLSLVLLLPLFRLTYPMEMLVLLLVGIAADIWLTVELPARRFIALGTTFTFFAFLAFGALTATTLSVVALLLAQALRVVSRNDDAHQGFIFTVFNAGQLAICTLAAGTVVMLVHATPLNQPPVQWLLPLLVYGLSYLVMNILLTSAAIGLRYNLREIRELLWPRVSVWTTLSLAICGPLALMAAGLTMEVGLLTAVLIAFVALLALSYILRLTLRYDRANAELTVLNEVGASLAATLDFGALFPAIYRGTGKLMDVNAFYIALIDETRREVQYAYLVEGGVELAPRTLPLGTGLVSQVVQSGEPLAIDQVEPEMLTGPRFGTPQHPTQSALIVPLRTGERLLGALSAQSYATQAYTPRQLELLMAIARIAAIAIRNAQLFEREKTLLREREEFVSLVAHELKNPLAAISGYYQIATRRLRPDDDGLRRPLEIISEQTERLNRLVEDLLDLSRADSGRLGLSLRPTDMRSLIKDVVEQQHAQGLTHPLHVELADDLPPVAADAMRIGQVVQNLLGNAIKYSPGGGAIDIRAQVWSGNAPQWPAHVRHTAAQHARWIVVEVQDHGLGIARTEVDKVFDRFFRANNTYEIQGVGLGLSICSELVRAHHGLIWVTSEIGVGSTFAFGLPVS